MSVPVIIGLVAVLLIVVLGFSMRGRAGTSGAGRQSAVIVILLVAAAALVLFYVL